MVDQPQLFALEGDKDFPPEYLHKLRIYMEFIQANGLRGSFNPSLDISDGKVLGWTFTLTEKGRPEGLAKRTEKA